MNKLNKCKLCNNTNLRPLKKYVNAGELARCISCGMVFSNLIPSESLLAEHYGRYGMFAELSPTTIKRYNELLDTFEQFRQKNRILDVGCGEGFFLEQAKRRGWDVHGTEYAPQYIEACLHKGINMQTGVLNLNNYPAESFDVIVSIEVIEHLLDPLKELENFNALLRPGGQAFITTPNFNSISRIILGKNWSVISYPDHVNYFTAGTLSKAMKKAGFKTGKIKTVGVSITRIQQTLFKKKRSNRLENGNHQDSKHEPLDLQWQSRIEGNPLLKISKNILNAILNFTRTGDGMKAFYKK